MKIVLGLAEMSIPFFMPFGILIPVCISKTRGLLIRMEKILEFSIKEFQKRQEFWNKYDVLYQNFFKYYSKTVLVVPNLL